VSASNYAVCPRCTARTKKKIEAALEEAKASYGVVPADVYAAKVAEAALPQLRDYSFREDYEIYGAEDGVVKVRYGGSCEACGLTVSFDHDHEIPGVAS
jgi:hypothetical protein